MCQWILDRFSNSRNRWSINCKHLQEFIGTTNENHHNQLWLVFIFPQKLAAFSSSFTLPVSTFINWLIYSSVVHCNKSCFILKRVPLISFLYTVKVSWTHSLMSGALTLFSCNHHLIMHVFAGGKVFWCFGLHVTSKNVHLHWVGSLCILALFLHQRFIKNNQK